MQAAHSSSSKGKKPRVRSLEKIAAMLEALEERLQKTTRAGGGGGGHEELVRRSMPELVPTAGQATAAEIAESEGALSGAFADDKKHPNDFALWKKSKPGECKWDSPWGEGRPGWHIECSVMASSIIGEKMDMHGGGSENFQFSKFALF